MFVLTSTVVRYSDRLDNIDIGWLQSKGCVLWFRGKNEVDFPILPGGVSATPSGTWASPLTLNNNRSLLTFNGTTNVISLTDSNAWMAYNGSLTICGWMRIATISSDFHFLQQFDTVSNFWQFYWSSSNGVYLQRYVSGVSNGTWYCGLTPSTDTWYHVAIIKSGTSTPAFYINNSQVSTTVSNAQTNTNQNISAPLSIHLTSQAGGNIKDLIMCNTEISMGELTYIYNTSKRYL